MNVSEHLTGEAIERYRAQESSVAEVLAVQQHLVACAPCRARLEARVGGDAAFLSLHRQLTPAADTGTLEEESHLAYDHLALYIDDALGEVEREIADTHLSYCGDCAADLTDLRQYRALATETALEPAAATEVAAAAAPVVPSAWQRFIGRLGSFKLSLPASAAGIAAVLVLITLGGAWLAMRNGEALNERDKSARAKSENGATPASDVASLGGTVPSPPASSSPVTGVESSGDNTGNTAPAPASSTMIKPRPHAEIVSPDRTPPSSAPFASPLIALNDGGARVSLNQQGRVLGLEALPPETRQAVSRALRSRQVETPAALVELADNADATLMGNSAGVASFSLLSPVGKIVREAQPVFHWQPLAGAKAYVVSLVDSHFQPVARSPALVETTWTPVAPLARGAVYYWQVEATLADGTEVTAPIAPARQARFRVLAASADDNLLQVEKTNPHSTLARGVAYAQAGLVEAAVAELEELRRQNPHSPIARDLLRSLRRTAQRRGIH